MNETPLMKQYWSIKSLHSDKIVFFRMGDFFELFHDDAIKASPILGIVLTQRNKNAKDYTPMCGVPHHAIGNQITKLLNHGFKVAICDQLEDASVAKGLVKRGITRILSPGMVYDIDLVEANSPLYICCHDEKSICFYDSTTQEGFYYDLITEEQISQLIQVLNPKEILEIKNDSPQYTILNYVKTMLNIPNFEILFVQKKLSQFLEIDQYVLKHLEIFENYDGTKENTFFSTLNQCQTPMGARLLRQWISFPLLDKNTILERQIEIEKCKNQNFTKIRDELSQIGDLERKLTQVLLPNPEPYLIRKFCLSLKKALNVMSDDQNSLHSIINFGIEQILNEPSNKEKGGRIINKGFYNELDELIDFNENSQKKLMGYELSEKNQSQIGSLKVKFNNVFGYFIEITKTHLDKVPSHYVRKQTLVGLERFTTPELSVLEGQIISAKTKRLEFELQVIKDIIEKLCSYKKTILELSQRIAYLDLISNFAHISIESNFVNPEFVDNKLKYIECRHPVVEKKLKNNFISNSVEINKEESIILTGPNMAGKSTFMRQIALNSILAQMGVGVCAKNAQIPIFKKIFTRIGSQDSLNQGLSTFMVEMKETAHLLKNSNQDTLVILDEVGRGTSTYDGMSLAQSILEYLVLKCKSTVLFATHFHELTTLDQNFTKIKNKHMKIKEKEGKLIFLYQLLDGASLKSFGIPVAELAGLPSEVLARAKEILKNYESPLYENKLQLSLIPQEENQVVEEIKRMSVSGITPLEALNKISKWQSELN